jgi:hypothetical protein
LKTESAWVTLRLQLDESNAMSKHSHTHTTRADAIEIATSWACGNALTAPMTDRVVSLAGRLER